MIEKDKKKIKRIVIIIVTVLLTLSYAFIVFWTATAYDRGLNKLIELTAGQIDSGYLVDRVSFEFDNIDYSNDETYIDFLATEINELCEKGDTDTLFDLLYHIEEEEVLNEKIQNVITDYFNNAENIDNIEIALRLSSYSMLYNKVKYYNSGIEFNKSKGFLAAYIESNGIEKITTTPGEGYYADEENKSSYERVGIVGSSLYDSTSEKYIGDFCVKSSSGRTLDRTTYKEKYYSNVQYYFRDNLIGFSPEDGECVYSGDYLFCFSANGDMIGFEEIN